MRSDFRGVNSYLDPIPKDKDALVSSQLTPE